MLNTSGLDLIGLLGVGLYTSGPDSTLTNINVLNTVSNLSFITSIPVLDIYGNNDNPASGTADARRNAYQGDNYTQEALTCPDNNGQYFAQVGLGFQPYYGNGAGDVNRCHQLRNGFLQDASNNFFPDVVLRGSPDAPLESVVRDWFSLNFVAIPEPETFLLLLIGLIGMRFIRRK